MTAAPFLLSSAAAPRDIEDDATALFRALSAAAAPQFASLGRLPTEAEKAIAAIETAWGAARVISFDVFDTLIVRKVAAPRDVFLHLATPAPFSAWGLGAVELSNLRQQAENEARSRGVKLCGSAEVTLHEIHGVLAELLHRPGTDVPAMVQAERLVERALCVTHPYLRMLYERAARDGKTLWCVSDTYHETEFLRELLEGCGFDLVGVEVFSSADIRMSKGEGKLLLEIAKAAGVSPRDVLHIGDHPRADCAIPAQQGFVAVCHPWAASRHSDKPAQAPGDSIALGLAQIGARAVEPAFPFWWRFGYAVAGPMLSGFACWLHSRFVTDGVQRAYFLLRDGEIILDVYKALLGERPGPATSLLESSRRAFVMPALTSGRASITSQLMACENARPAKEFLERIGLHASEFKSSFKAVGLGLDEIVAPNDTAVTTKVISLLGRTDVVNAMLARSQTERQLLLRYLQQEGVFAPGRVAVVDIGWNGTIQKALSAVAAIEKRPLDLHGYYLGTLPPINQDLGGSIANGFLFDAGAPVDHANAILHLRQLVEFICTTTRGSLRGFRADGGTVVPVHGSVDHPAAQQAHVGHLRDGALAYARGLAQERQVFGEQPISAAAAIRHLARTIMEPTAEEAREIGDIHHGDGLGSDRLRSLAAFRDGPFTPQSLAADFEMAYWQIGLMARREPAALALRAMHWLHGA